MNGQVVSDTQEKLTDEGVSASNVKLIPKGTVLLSFKLTIGKTAIAGKDLYTNEAIAGLIPIRPKEVIPEYLFYMFKGKLIDLEHVGRKAFGKSLNITFLKDHVMIPMPTPQVQKNVVSECKKIDKEYLSTRMSDEAYRSKIASIFKKKKIIDYK